MKNKYTCLACHVTTNNWTKHCKTIQHKKKCKNQDIFSKETFDSNIVTKYTHLYVWLPKNSWTNLKNLNQG